MLDEDMFVCFNSKQVRFVKALTNLRLIKPTRAGGVRHPITGNTEIIFQKCMVNRIVSIITHKIFDALMDSEGKARLQRMKDCGALKIAMLSKEEIENKGDLYLCF